MSLWIFDLLTMSESKENNENMANTNTNTTLTRYPVTLRDDQRIPVRAFCDPTPPANGFRFSTHEAVDPTRFIVSLSPEDSHRVFVYPHCAPSVEYEDQNLWTDDLGALQCANPHDEREQFAAEAPVVKVSSMLKHLCVDVCEVRLFRGQFHAGRIGSIFELCRQLVLFGFVSVAVYVRGEWCVRMDEHFALLSILEAYSFSSLKKSLAVSDAT